MGPRTSLPLKTGLLPYTQQPLGPPLLRVTLYCFLLQISLLSLCTILDSSSSFYSRQKDQPRKAGGGPKTTLHGPTPTCTVSLVPYQKSLGPSHPSLAMPAHRSSFEWASTLPFQI